MNSITSLTTPDSPGHEARGLEIVASVAQGNGRVLSENLDVI